MNLIYAIVLLTAHITATWATQNATYMCFFNGTHKRIDMSIVEGTGEPEILKVFGTLGGSECDITLNETRFSVHITPGQPMCGVLNGTTAYPNGTGYHLTAITSSAMGAITVTDAKYVIDCEFDVVNTEITIEVDSTLITNGVVATGTAIVETETVSMGIVDAVNGLALNSVSFGDSVKLRAILIKRNIAGAATGISIHDCSALNSLVSPTKTVDLIGADGCTPPGLGLYADGIGFSKSSDVLNAYTTDSPTFQTFIMIDGTANIAFRCNATFCYQGDSSCDTSCASLSRKKRQAESLEDTETSKSRQLVALLTVSKERLLALKRGENNQDIQKSDRQPEFTACTSKVNIVGMAILGAILAITAVVAIGFFVVIIKFKNQAAATKYVS